MACLVSSIWPTARPTSRSARLGSLPIPHDSRFTGEDHRRPSVALDLPAEPLPRTGRVGTTNAGSWFGRPRPRRRRWPCLARQDGCGCWRGRPPRQIGPPQPTKQPAHSELRCSSATMRDIDCHRGCHCGVSPLRPPAKSHASLSCWVPTLGNRTPQSFSYTTTRNSTPYAVKRGRRNGIGQQDADSISSCRPATLRSAGRPIPNEL